MPPAAVRTLRDLVYWQYAKIISNLASIGKSNYGFVVNRFKKLQNEEIFWNSIREYVKEKEVNAESGFCNSASDLSLDIFFQSTTGAPTTKRTSPGCVAAATHPRVRILYNTKRTRSCEIRNASTSGR